MTMHAEKPPGAGLPLTCTLSTHEALVEVAQAVAARTAELAGCMVDDAEKLGTAIRTALEALISQVPAVRRPGELEVAFGGTERILRVDLSYDTAPGADGIPFEQLLGEGEAGQKLRGLVDRVEFGRDGTRQSCRLTRQIKRPR